MTSQWRQFPDPVFGKYGAEENTRSTATFFPHEPFWLIPGARARAHTHSICPERGASKGAVQNGSILQPGDIARLLVLLFPRGSQVRVDVLLLLLRSRTKDDGTWPRAVVSIFFTLPRALYSVLLAQEFTRHNSAIVPIVSLIVQL
jgi:hypothetical protein